MLEMVKRSVKIVLYGAILLAGASAAWSLDIEKEKEAITTMLRGSIEAGYNEQDLEKILTAYEDRAKIISYIMGEGNKERLRTYLARDFSDQIKNVTELDILQVSFDGGEATAHVLLKMVKTRRDNQPIQRGDHFYMRLHKGDEGWKVYLQSYRPDFGISDLPHGGRGGPVTGPAQRRFENK